MNAEASWQRLKREFGLCLDQPEPERDAWLTDHCSDAPALLAELRRLLAARQTPRGILDDDAQALLGRLLPPEQRAEAALGYSIGPYRLVRLLGEGGMGSVYLAERHEAEFVHQVALKRVRAEFVDPELRRRFLRERQILARLQHPHIAQLHDGGVAQDGSPYFTLEYVEGEPITRWCDARQLGVVARIKLLLGVCDAVEYAHRNLIVHRDLKPSNLLVTNDGQVKLLDFGIAKLLDTELAPGLTGNQARVMTREYAAPEQVLGEAITTATDVYALGVLLYELLTGHLPYVEAERGAIGWSKAIVEETPQSLSRALSRTEVAASPGAATLAAHRIAAARGTSPARLRSALRGDLERIVQRALQKSPEARYASVAALADDLNAFVQARPISGGSRRYRLRKFISRHWLPLGAGTAAILALVIGAVAFAREARQREQEAERALREQQTTKAVKDFLFGLFGGIDPYEAKRKDVSARELLDRGAQRIDKELAGEPATKAEVQAVLGRIYYQLGLYPQASELQQRAIEALKGDAGHALLLARTETDRVDTLRSIGDFAAAAPLAADAAARLDAAADVVAVDRVRALNALTKLAVAKRDFAAAKEHSDASLALARSAKVLDALLADTLLTAGTSAWGLGLLDEAEARQREALAITTRLNGPDDPLAAIAHTNLAMTLRARSRFAEALEEIQAALATRSKVLGADHPSVVTNRVDLGLTQYHLGHYREAREVLQQAIDTMKAQAADNPNIPGAQINLGLALAESGDLDGAEGAFVAAQEAWQKKYGAEYPGVLVAKGNLGYVHQLRGELERAETELKEVKALGEKRGVKDDVSTLYRLGEVRRLRGDAAEAIALDRQALELARKGGGENNRFAALAHYCLGLALRDSGDRAAAEQEFRAALASFAGYLPGGAHPYAATARLELAQLRQSQAETRAEDVKLVNEAVELRERFLGPEDPRTRAARLQLQQLQARR